MRYSHIQCSFILILYDGQLARVLSISISIHCNILKYDGKLARV